MVWASKSALSRRQPIPLFYAFGGVVMQSVAHFSHFLKTLDAKAAHRPTMWRWMLAGPIAFLLAVLNMASLPLVLPAGEGGINHLLLPVLFFPLIWSIYCVWPVSTERLGRCAFWYCVATALCVLALLFQFLR